MLVKSATVLPMACHCSILSKGTVLLVGAMTYKDGPPQACHNTASILKDMILILLNNHLL